jgi:hypothetical protein
MPSFRGKCSNSLVGEKVYDYYNGALEAAEVRQFEQHLIQCAECEATVLQLDEMIHLLGDEPDYDPLAGKLIQRPTTGSLLKVGI